ncbi:MAG: hypothetical protein L6R35_005386 [Caloplaca aegaea]|nr:MAG: hypothetical protein L6R35_005386 [Caloplaca aegaea]
MMATSSHKRKIVIYAGAPFARSLNWTEEHLTALLQPCFSDDNPSRTPLDISNRPQWRSLPLEHTHLPTGLTQATNPEFVPNPTANPEETSFLSTTDLASSPSSDIPASKEDESEVLTQYYEHSFAVHENLPSSQILPASSSSPVSSSPDSSFSTSLNDSTTAATAAAADTIQRQLLLSAFFATAPTDLSSVPTAAYLHSITPQTMTLNLLVGIIAIPPPRIITMRRGKSRTVDLVEMIVGDETKAGFGVNIWLSSSSSSNPLGQQQQKDKHALQLKEQMRDLRPRDVVLMRNVALTSFRGKVYGQSLRRGMTGVELVWRSVLDARDRQGLFEGWEVEEGDVGMEKVRKVREWVLRFVGGGGGGCGVGDRARGDGGGAGRRMLPADTQ